VPRPTCKSGPRTLQEWAKDKVAPREEEISQLRNLIRRIEADVSEFDDQDQALIAEAVSVIPDPVPQRRSRRP